MTSHWRRRSRLKRIPRLLPGTYVSTVEILLLFSTLLATRLPFARWSAARRARTAGCNAHVAAQAINARVRHYRVSVLRRARCARGTVVRTGDENQEGFARQIVKGDPRHQFPGTDSSGRLASTLSELTRVSDRVTATNSNPLRWHVFATTRCKVNSTRACVRWPATQRSGGAHLRPASAAA